MDLIKNLLEKYKINLDKSQIFKSEIIKVIEGNFKIKLNSKDIEVKLPVIYIKNQPAVFKSEIFLSREEMISKLSDSLGEGVVKEIKLY